MFESKFQSKFSWKCLFVATVSMDSDVIVATLSVYASIFINIVLATKI